MAASTVSTSTSNTDSRKGVVIPMPLCVVSQKSESVSELDDGRKGVVIPMPLCVVSHNAEETEEADGRKGVVIPMPLCVIA